MVVYRFKFDQFTADSGKVTELIEYLQSVKNDNSVINYTPSKKAVIYSSDRELYHLISWIKANVTYDFEFETHQEGKRTLTQVHMEKEVPFVSVQYLLPLFPVESYLEL